MSPFQLLTVAFLVHRWNQRSLQYLETGKESTWWKIYWFTWRKKWRLPTIASLSNPQKVLFSRWWRNGVRICCDSELDRWWQLNGLITCIEKKLSHGNIVNALWLLINGILFSCQMFNICILLHISFLLWAFLSLCDSFGQALGDLEPFCNLLCGASCGSSHFLKGQGFMLQKTTVVLRFYIS